MQVIPFPLLKACEVLPKYSIRVQFDQDRKVLHILEGSPSTPKSIAGIDLICNLIPHICCLGYW